MKKIAMLPVLALVLAPVAFANTLTFSGGPGANQGSLSFTPGTGNTLSIGSGNGGSGALISEFLDQFVGPCSGGCAISGGYLTLTTGGETSGGASSGSFSYSFASGGTIDIYGGDSSLGIAPGTLLFSADFASTGATFGGSGSVGSLSGFLDLSSIYIDPAFSPNPPYNGASADEISIDLDDACSTGGACSGAIEQADVTISAIPEGGAALLYLLLALGACFGAMYFGRNQFGGCAAA